MRRDQVQAMAISLGLAKIWTMYATPVVFGKSRKWLEKKLMGAAWVTKLPLMARKVLRQFLIECAVSSCLLGAADAQVA